MVAIRSINDIILGLIDYFKLVQPNLDTKPGTVARDLFIEAPATQLSLIYEELANVSNLQSLLLVSGSDLDKLAKNFGLSRRGGIPAIGTALLTFNSLDAPFAINANDLVITKSGLAFKVTTGVSITPASVNIYKSTASKFRNDLDFVGINDQYAVQVLVQASFSGSSGNIGKYYLSRSTSSGISGVTNTSSFTGGADQESDSAFRNRILGLFNGSSIGTALGYKSLATSTQNVFDAVVVEPGDPLMTRDGTEVSIASDGTRTIISEGSGGKVDVVILGQNLLQTLDTFVYQDKSNVNDPTNEKNNYVLGQIAGDENKTINRRRVDNIKTGTLPSQPVNTITSVLGSLSGPNFKPKTVDSLGRVFGNYELVKDTGEYAGSPWGFDKFRWVSDRISDFSEEVTRQNFNTQDKVSYTDVISSSSAQQNISIVSENSSVTSDRSIIQLLHYPCINVTRVFNVNTGERYFVADQGIDAATNVNLTGRIKITGNTLPLTTDVLQVDYIWVFKYDSYLDYDGKLLSNNIRDSIDSVDWGYASQVREERVLFELNGTTGIYVGKTSHLISSVSAVNMFRELDGEVYTISSGVNTGRKAITLYKLPVADKLTSIQNIYLKNTFRQAWQTAENNGSFSILDVSVPGKLLYNAVIILPTDAGLVDGDLCTVQFNSSNIYSSTCSFSGSGINIPSGNINLASNSRIYLNVSYISNTGSLVNYPTKSLPLSKSGNGFIANNLGKTTSNYNLLTSSSLTVQKNIYNQFYVELEATTSEFTLAANNVLAVIRNNDSKVLWDSLHLGTVNWNTGNLKYQIILSTSSGAAVGDQVTAFYYLKDNSRNQPFSFVNYKILSQLGELNLSGGKYSLPLISFEDTSSLKIQVIDPVYQIVLAQAMDGYLFSYDGYGEITTNSIAFNQITQITNYKLKIEDGYHFNNNGVFDILGFDPASKTFTFSTNLDHISKNQISVIRLSDNKEIWNNNCSISQGKLIIADNGLLEDGDKVFINYYNYNNLRSAQTTLSSAIFDQNISSGSITIEGTSIAKLENIIFTSTGNGLEVDLSDAVAKGLGYYTYQLPQSTRVVRVVKLEKIQTAGNSDEVVDTIVSYDVKNCQINDNTFFMSELVENKSLNNFSIILPSTIVNTTSTSTANNLPNIGDKLRVTLYIAQDDNESIDYTSPGLLYSNKKFAIINKVSCSGFRSSSSSSLTINTMNQPTTGARYKVFYDYLAPKQNERITINYNYNQTISDVTFNIENNRPINADVIVKEATKILVDVTMNIVISATYINSSALIAQNVKDKLISAINLNTLGSIIDGSDLVNQAYSVTGVDRSRIIYFNKNGVVGQALSLTAQNNEYFSANNVIVNVETR